MVRFGLFILIALLLPLGSLSAAQDTWNAIQSATGWASFDKDGSCTFYEPATKKLINWSWDGGVLGKLDLAHAQGRPDKWVMDSAGDAWVVTGTTLQFFEKNGHPGATMPLPAEVGDLAWDAVSFVLCYRTQTLYLEKRDLKTGALVWSYGAKPAKGSTIPQTLHHIAVKEDSQIIIASGSSLDLTTLDGAKGKLLRTDTFTHDGAPTPALALGQQDRGPIVWWLDTGIAVAGVPSSQLPDLKLNGLLLIKLDLAQKTATYLPTELPEAHTLVGILDKTAVLRSPTGGLTFFSME